LVSCICENLGVEEEPWSGSTYAKILAHVKDVKNVRAFGLMLKVESGRLDQVEGDHIAGILQTWFKMVAMSHEDRWEEVIRALLQPAVREVTIAHKMRYQLPPNRTTSVDSAISMVSSSPRSSIDSAAPPDPYQENYIGKW